ncbi:hypothetical protein PMI14_01838 [Acidovorax sp. CF316]|nr:hypothetical protein PMI14_01838 [Acidovorax sp. CF316]
MPAAMQGRPPAGTGGLEHHRTAAKHRAALHHWLAPCVDTLGTHYRAVTASA